METQKYKVLFIDNFDSFTYNLVDDFRKRSCSTIIYRADTDLQVIIDRCKEFEPDLLVLSPGPGNPEGSGVTLQALDYFKDKLPIFGVCLGLQVIVHYFGGAVGHAKEVMHGKPSKVTHSDSEIFKGIENPMQAGRYHSLAATKLPDCLEVTANYNDIVMGVKHKELPIYGVQFHPESILTPAGGKIIDNVLAIASGQSRKGY